jgi:hypothetical protein
MTPKSFGGVFSTNPFKDKTNEHSNQISGVSHFDSDEQQQLRVKSQKSAVSQKIEDRVQRI